MSWLPPVDPAHLLQDQQRPTADTELAVDVLEVLLDRVFGDAELLSNFLVGQTLQQQQNDLLLANGAAVRRVERRQLDP